MLDDIPNEDTPNEAIDEMDDVENPSPQHAVDFEKVQRLADDVLFGRIDKHDREKVLGDLYQDVMLEVIRRRLSGH